MTLKKIAILCAMNEEAELIIQEFQLKKLENDFFEIYQKEGLILLVSKIGKTYAALGTQWLIREYQVDVVINIGLAGGLKPEFSIGKVFLGKSVLQHDVYLPWDGEHLNYLKGMISFDAECKMLHSLGLPQGTILTGDQFIDDPATCKRLSKIGDIVDMEAFSVASTCRLFKIPCILLKAISDNADDSAAGTFEENIEKAMKNSIPVFKSLIEFLA